MAPVIWWIRRDLRIQDNQALSAALASGAEVLPVFILDPKLLSNPAAVRQAFLFEGVRNLRRDIQALGGDLCIRAGDPLETLTRFTAATGAENIFCEEDFTPYSRQRDARIARHLLLTHAGFPTVLHPADTKKDDGSPYTVFTPFSKKWKALPVPSPVRVDPGGRFAKLQDVDNDPIPDPGKVTAFPAGETVVHQALEEFLINQVAFYSEDRNRLDLDGTSRLSPSLRFGIVSVREAAWEVRQRIINLPSPKDSEGGEVWLNELIWRDFYASILYHYPTVLREAFQPRYRTIEWRDAPTELERWKFGQTGFPVVDAGMRQLLQLGWMHNRARMITASFLVKDLLINWQEGEDWFMQNLVDGDPASNNGGWQWTAGVGTDAAPYFRIFNPTTQGIRFDPSGNYIRTWVPELAAVPDEFIHQPEKMPVSVQQKYGCILGKSYPYPMVDHSLARARTMAAFKATA